MIKKILVFFVALLGFLVFLSVNPVLAATQFSSSYDVTYDIGEDGITDVTEDIILKNLTDRYFASDFNLNVGSTKIDDVVATDTSGDLPITTKQDGKKTQITVKFNQQIVGKGKEYKWKLKFKSKDFAEAQGKVWQVSVPKISTVEGMEGYNLTLKVPLKFGDASSIMPEPKSQSEEGGKLVFRFSKDQLLNSGILGTFGTEQLMNFRLIYKIPNVAFFPTVLAVALPANSKFQRVLFTKIEPKPENVTIDRDGNYLGWFKVNGRQSLEVQVEGLAKIEPYVGKKREYLSAEQQKAFTSAQKYWESSNQEIKVKVKELFREKQLKDNDQKAELINQFVAANLKYNENKQNSQRIQRLGALTILANPDKALSPEYSDLFVSLARAADIPSRQLVGVAYTTNNELRPQEYLNSNLHSWVQYYSEKNGWVMADPTWQSTSGGVDYFSRFDLNHLVVAIHGYSSDEPLAATEAKISFGEAEFKTEPKLWLSIYAPDELFSGFPAKLKVRVENVGNSQSQMTDLNLFSGKILLSGLKFFKIPELPPKGFFEYEYDLRVGSIFESFSDTVTLKVGDQVLTKTIIIKPFFAYRNLTMTVIFVLSLIFLSYVGVLIWHFKRPQFAKEIVKVVSPKIVKAKKKTKK